MRVEIIGIGTEILLGHIVNTNSSYISQKLAQLGIDVYYHTTVGDNPLRLYTTIQKALSRADIVMTTGGLGPTIDDVTLETIAKVLSKKLEFKKQIWAEINNHFKKRGIKPPKNNIRQAHIPKGAIWLKNSIGTAPGIISKAGPNQGTLIALPGPPSELAPMIEKFVIPYLKKLLGKKTFIITSKVLKTTGLAESQIHPKVEKFLKMSGKTTVGIYAHDTEVDIKITTKSKNKKLAQKNILSTEKQIRKQLGSLVFGTDHETLESVVANLLSNSKKTIAVAESCTGGLLTNRLTDIPGSSKYLMHSIVSYSNKSKSDLLYVPDNVLKKYGAVSSQTAQIMAKNIRLIANSDIGISITGIAGPGGGSKKKPIGLVYIALSEKSKITCRRFQFCGERKLIKFRASCAALDILRRSFINAKDNKSIYSYQP